jgi:PAS domain S-box-containing protein
MSSHRNEQLKSFQHLNARLRNELSSARDETAFYKQIIEGTNDGLWHYDQERDKLWVSPHWWRGLGYRPENAPSNIGDMLKFVHPDDVDQIKTTLKSYSDRPTTEYACEFRIRTAVGDERRIRSCAHYIPTGRAPPRFIVGTHADITAIHKQHEENQQLFQMFELIFNSIPHLIGVKNAKGEFLFANQAMALFYGAKNPSEMLGKHDFDYNKKKVQVDRFIEDDLWVIKSRKERLIAKEENTDSKGRKHWLTTIKVPLLCNDGTVNVVFVATFIDEVIRLQDRIKESREMAELAKMMAHKLGTRIYTLENFVSRFSYEGQKKKEVMAAIEDLKQFSDDFLALSMSDRIKLQKTNLILILNRALNSMVMEADIQINGKPLRSRMSIDPRFDIVADETKLVDLFAQLGKNSLEWANRAPHHIDITVERIDKLLPSMSILPQYNSSPTKFKILFADNGPGIKLAQRKHLFKPFSSGKPQGTGLGLAIIRRVTEAHDGIVNEIGNEATGACFEIVLPATAQQKEIDYA